MKNEDSDFEFFVSPEPIRYFSFPHLSVVRLRQRPVAIGGRRELLLDNVMPERMVGGEHAPAPNILPSAVYLDWHVNQASMLPLLQEIAPSAFGNVLTEIGSFILHT